MNQDPCSVPVECSGRELIRQGSIQVTFPGNVKCLETTQGSGAEWWIGVGGASPGSTGREGLSVQLVF